MGKRKVVTDKSITEIKKGLEDEKILVGTDECLKSLKLGKLQKVFLSSNTKEESKEEIEKLAAISDVEIVELKYPNDELGTMCKKPFPISVLALVK